MNSWYYARGKQKLGPISFDQLQQLAASGELQPTDMVLQEDARIWTAAWSVDGLYPQPVALPANTCSSAIKIALDAQAPKAATATPTESAARPIPQIAQPIQPRPGDVWTNSLGMKFAFVPRGKFRMGGGGGQRGNDIVEITSDYYLGVYPVTQAQWQAVMDCYNPSWFSRDGEGQDKVRNISDAELKDFPVENVSWEECQEFIDKLNEREANSGWLYRLPTEAEWEYACRGGASSSGGTISDRDCSFHFYFDRPTNALSSEQANFHGNYPYGDAPNGPYLQRTCRVGSYKSNRLGIYDLHGNVWELCEDSREGSSYRVLRGGSWDNIGVACQAVSRSEVASSFRANDVGVRLVRVPSGR